MLALSNLPSGLHYSTMCKKLRKEAGNRPVGKALLPTGASTSCNLSSAGGDHTLSSFAEPILSFAECQEPARLVEVTIYRQLPE